LSTEIFPIHIERLDQTYAIWFERSNSYVILSIENFELFNLFLKSKSKQGFVEATKNLVPNTTDVGLLHREFSQLCKSANTPQYLYSKFSLSHEAITIPNLNITRFYKYNNFVIEVNFSSETIENLFHPSLYYIETNETSNPDAIFNVFKNGEKLVLASKHQLIYECLVTEYHFMQGHFAMELTNFVHQKSKSHWLASFHASTIVKDNKSIMLMGDSGNGKSTLTAILTSNGFELLADDFTPMYADDLKLYKYPNAISIKPGAFDALREYIDDFAEIPSAFHTNKQLGVKYLWPKVNSARNIISASCRTIVYVKYIAHGEQDFLKTNEEKVLKTLIPDSWTSPKPDHAKKFLSWLKGINFYELYYNDNDFAVSSLNSTVKTS